jgi:membrane protease YdiL (CAAX protease family)
VGQTPPPAGSGARVAEPRPQASLVEPILTFFAATALASALYWIARVVPLVWEYLHVAIAVIFLTAPGVASRVSRRPFDYEAAGLRLDPVKRGLAVVGGAIGMTWPFFFAGFVLLYRFGCGPGLPAALRRLLRMFIASCEVWHGWAGASFQLPERFLELGLVQIAVIAVPEELFFRGYLWTRFEQRWPSRWRFLGADVGPAWLLSAVAFGLGHVLVDFDPQRLAVFFPALVFGWMRARTGSIAAGVLFHALCNLFSDALHASFLR